MVSILVVDDAAFMRMQCAKMLSENGYEVVEAIDGQDAVQKYQSHNPDVVLLDITMPNMDGIATLRKLIELDPQAKVAMVTAMGQHSMVVEALRSGAREFVVKPFDAPRVLRAVQKLAA